MGGGEGQLGRPTFGTIKLVRFSSCHRVVLVIQLAGYSLPLLLLFLGRFVVLVLVIRINKHLNILNKTSNCINIKLNKRTKKQNTTLSKTTKQPWSVTRWQHTHKHTPDFNHNNNYFFLVEATDTTATRVPIQEGSRSTRATDMGEEAGSQGCLGEGQAGAHRAQKGTGRTPRSHVEGCRE